MASETSSQGLSLYDAARAMGVTFTQDTVPEDKYIQANDLNFHYLDWGNPDNPPALLLHGFAQTCHSWDFVALSLSDRFHVHTLDQRGHGDSDWAATGDYDQEAFYRDLVGFVEALSLPPAVFVGLSMCGQLAFRYAASIAS